MVGLNDVDAMSHRSAAPLDQASRWWTLAAGAACLLPLLLQLPGALAIGIGAVALLIPLLARQGSAPVWLRLILVLALLSTVLVVYRFAFGRDTGCALLATMLALKPVELRQSRDARSLLGFALFAPFATFLLDQGPLSLGFGLIGAAAALAALLKLSEVESGDAVSAGPLWRRFGVIGRMVAIGLPLALVAFWLFPRLGAPLWGVPNRALARTGLSDHMSPGDWIDMIGDESPALRATFFGAAPPKSEMYWRGPVLWNFDGRNWSALDWARSQPPAPSAPGKQRYDYEMEIEPTDRPQMVALDLPLSTPENRSPDNTVLDHDYSLRALQPLSALSRWRMRSAAPAQFESELDPRLREHALRLPNGFNPRTIALGEQWRREAEVGLPGATQATRDAAIVERALRWVRAEFVYTLDAQPLGHDSVDEFLFDKKAGFCEHFSSSFVVLMRAAGIPARVVTGYAGGYRNPIGGYWLVRRSDAHAWSEVWLQNRGWVRVDPTAAVAPERIYDTIDDRMPGMLGGFSGLTPVFNVSDWLRRGWNDFVLGFDASRQRQLLGWLGMPDADANRLALLFVLATSLALGVMWWLTTRNERERDPVLRAWRRLELRYRRIGLARERYEPAQVWAQRVLAQRPHVHKENDHSLLTLSAHLADWRYARDHGGATTAAALIRDLRRHRP